MPEPLIDPEAPQPMGIVERLTRDDSERKRFLKMVGGAGAASFGAFVLAACGSSSSSSKTTATTAATAPAKTGTASASGDLAIANYALTLEWLETTFYERVVSAGLFKGAVGSLIADFARQEASHVQALQALIKQFGGKPVSRPKATFPIDSATQVAKLAYTVENLGAAAYLGQAANIQSPTVLAAALSIHSVEARHAATLGTLVYPGAGQVNTAITPDGAFGKPADMATVLAAVKPFLA
ncbi:MAG TPA: ferritin-like domain-containing protein [Solirubrobacteraceae bacterium]|jgi:rubrerythrin|nr:ferritin-like domain-containing protein [Solirubrobacteraceae bacterium]